MHVLPLVALLFPSASASEAFGDAVYYFGDLHAHTGYSGDAGSTDVGHCISTTACGAVADLATDARANGLDFLAVTDHVNGFRAMSDADYLVQNATVLAQDDTANGFVMIPAGELWFYRGNSISDPLGHKTLLMFESNAVLSGLTLTDVRPQYSPHITSCDQIWDWADTLSASFGDILLVPHHPATRDPMPTNWSCHDADYEPAAEVYSRHGNSLEPDSAWDVPGAGVVTTGYVSTAIDPDGYDISFGFVGGTDSHDTTPGETCHRDTMQSAHLYGGGLTVAVMDPSETFERSSIHDAMVDHRTYTSSGPMFALDVSYSVDGTELGGIGDDLTLYEHDDLEVTVTLPEDEAAYVSSVDLIGPDGTWTLDASDSATWSTTVAGLDLRGYVYVRVNVDGSLLYGSACSDGGSDHDEHLWVSPSQITLEDDDLDDDGALLDVDCDDANAAIYPGAIDTPYDGVDSDCGGGSDFDADGDGQDSDLWDGADCDDDDLTIFAGATETFYDGVDSDCDGASDFDQDGDGFDAADEGGDDCDDLAADIHPSASDVWYDGVDSDCRGDSDYDRDGDGFETDAEGGDDCNDLDAAINPGMYDALYDGVDTDCGGESDFDGDADGYEFYEEAGDDCDDEDASVHPGAYDAAGDGVDADCDGEDPVVDVVIADEPTVVSADTGVAAEPDGTSDSGDASGVIDAIVDVIVAVTADTGDTGDTAETGDTGSSGSVVAPDPMADTGTEVAAPADPSADTGIESDTAATPVATGARSSSSDTASSPPPRRRHPRGRPPLLPDGSRPPLPPLNADGTRPRLHRP